MSGRSIGFALLGESLFPNAEKVTKKSCPCIRVSLRSTSLIPSLLRGSPRKGHPWPFTALAASMPLAPLRSDSIRPSERGVRCRLMVGASAKMQSVLLCYLSFRRLGSSSCWLRRVENCGAFSTGIGAGIVVDLRPRESVGKLRVTHPTCGAHNRFVARPVRHRRIAPFRRPNAGGVEGVERHGCRESRVGPWMAQRGGPLERHWREGTPAQPGPYAGARLFAYFFGV